MINDLTTVGSCYSRLANVVLPAVRIGSKSLFRSHYNGT